MVTKKYSQWGGVVQTAIVVACLVATGREAVAQATTTVFQDTFTTGGNTAWTTSGTIGSSSWSVTRSGADWGARINTSPAQLELTNDASGTTNVLGWVYASTPTSGFASPWSSTLSSNPGLVTWEFNMRQSRTDPAGFSSGSYGAAFVLGATSPTVATSGSGYAIVLGQSGGTDPIRLATFNNGLQGTLTDVISGTGVFADVGAEYLSVRVSYNPTSNGWLLYGGTSASFGDPTATLSLTGSASNSTYTGTTLTSMGGYWQGSTGASQTAFFDNVYVKVEQAASGNTDLYWGGANGWGSSSPGTGGNGTWADGSGSWDPAKLANFAGSSGAVTIQSASAANGVRFTASGYTLTSGTLTLTGSTGQNFISADAGVTAIVNSVIAGSAGFSKTGAGSLTLGGENTFTGGLTVSSGTLQVSSDGNFGDAGNDIALASTLKTTSSVSMGFGRDVTGSGTLDIAPGTTLTTSGAFDLSSTTLSNSGTLDLQGATRSVGVFTFGTGATVNGSGAISMTGLTATAVTSGSAVVNPAITFSTGDKTVSVGTGGTLLLSGSVSLATNAGTEFTKEGAGTLILSGSGSSISRWQIGRAASSPTNGGVLRVSDAGGLGAQEIYFNWGTIEPTAAITTPIGISLSGRSASKAVIGGAGGNEAVTFEGGIRFYGPNGTAGEIVLDVNNDTTFSGIVTGSTSATISGLTLSLIHI